jgi:diadenosine tetraphosphatase ApaH/serine/threonine PP2A family protein phosphatase
MDREACWEIVRSLSSGTEPQGIWLPIDAWPAGEKDAIIKTAMRYAIISDIHSNLVALEAVMQHMEAQGAVDEVWCLGDLVGYGPEPNQCIQLLRRYPHRCIAGNHDWAAIGRIDTSDFNPDAAAANRWTAQQLTAESRAYLEALPLTLRQADFTLAHGSPRDPIWEYLLSQTAALASFRHFEGPYCLVGHSHVPLLFHLDQETRLSLRRLPEGQPFRLGEGRWIINPGSVGQPRDGDPRAAYLVYDEEASTFQHFRLPYDVGRTQQRMLELGLPPFLAERLSYGQ